jgi:hypothetical protein
MDAHNIDNKVELLYNRAFSKRYSGNDKVFTTHIIKELPTGKSRIIDVIKDAIIKYKDVRTGFTSTSIRGHHSYYILCRGEKK